MKKPIFAVLLTLVAVLGGLILNFRALVWGGANVWNVQVMVCCILLWGFAIYLAAKNKSRRVLMYCFVFWAVAVFLAAVGLYVVSSDFLHNQVTAVLVPLQMLLYGQFAGLEYFNNDFRFQHITVMLISAIMATVSMILYRRVRRGGD